MALVPGKPSRSRPKAADWQITGSGCARALVKDGTDAAPSFPSVRALSQTAGGRPSSRTLPNAGIELSAAGPMRPKARVAPIRTVSLSGYFTRCNSAVRNRRGSQSEWSQAIFR